MASGNPFAPTFGASPPVLAGRDDILTDVGDAFDTGPGHPDYTVLFIGVRGAGKTAMLNAVEDLARERGWIVISDTASPVGLLGRLVQTVTHALVQLTEGSPRRRLTGVAAMSFGIEVEHVPRPDTVVGLRAALTELGDLLASRETGLLITLDELQSGDMDELREFGAILQHVTRREQRPIAFAGAALPQIDDTLLSDDSATFLQRCSRYDIDRLDAHASAIAIAEPIRRRNGSIDDAALRAAVEATSGYAFMVQLVGFHTWKAAADPTRGISLSEAESGITEASRRIGRLVLAPTWKGLSDIDRRFLIAMAHDEHASRLADIADRLGVNAKFAGVYRHRLINAGMIVAAGRGWVDFAHHTTRAWLRTKLPLPMP